MAEVSVIVPVYNQTSYLRATLQSVADQSFQDWELIVVDDGSQPECAHQILAAVQKVSRARLITLAKNLGPSGARNIGIYHSTGRYVAFLDGDDLWEPEKLAKQVEVMESDEDIGMCYTAWNRIDHQGNCLGQGGNLTAETYLQLLKRFCIIPSTVMARREYVCASGGFDTAYKYGEIDLFLKLAKKWKLRRLEAVLTSYRLHPASISRCGTDEIFPEAMNIFEKYSLTASKEELAAIKEGVKWFRQHIGNLTLDRCRDAAYKGELGLALLHFWRTIKTAQSLEPVIIRMILFCQERAGTFFKTPEEKHITSEHIV